MRRTQNYGVDVLINNAGYQLSGPLELISDEDLRAQFDTNVFGLMAVTRAFIPQMRERRSGRIINISSAMGQVTLPFMGAYNATKYSVEALSDALRNELALFGIYVILIEPGVTRTSYWQRESVSMAKYVTPDSPYAASLPIAEKYLNSLEAAAPGPEGVTQVIQRAILADKPAARYVPTFKDQMFIRVFTLLPTALVDKLKRGWFGLDREDVSAEAALVTR
ncbi:MAG: SDR family NAD(P)-dependent oxidoreductase [Chloroflexi bacterium]|nr:SDR family NAD(P)-dependent oxidoreductase [Chloroflexota bacterium]